MNQELQQGRPKPESITTDNGSEFVGKALDAWAVQHGVKLDFIRPGRPVENGYVESFHGRLRDECLKAEIFFSLADAQRKLNIWREDYNHHRPHSSLADRNTRRFRQAPSEIATNALRPPNSNYSWREPTSRVRYAGCRRP